MVENRNTMQKMKQAERQQWDKLVAVDRKTDWQPERQPSTVR